MPARTRCAVLRSPINRLRTIYASDMWPYQCDKIAEPVHAHMGTRSYNEYVTIGILHRMIFLSADGTMRYTYRYISCTGPYRPDMSVMETEQNELFVNLLGECAFFVCAGRVDEVDLSAERIGAYPLAQFIR